MWFKTANFTFIMFRCYDHLLSVRRVVLLMDFTAQAIQFVGYKDVSAALTYLEFRFRFFDVKSELWNLKGTELPLKPSYVCKL